MIDDDENKITDAQSVSFNDILFLLYFSYQFKKKLPQGVCVTTLDYLTV